MTALYFHVLGPKDKVAVKPHTGPVLNAIEYLFGNQYLEGTHPTLEEIDVIAAHRDE